MKVIRFAYVRFSQFRTVGAIFVEDHFRSLWLPLSHHRCHFRGYAAINAPQALICIHPKIGLLDR